MVYYSTFLIFGSINRKALALSAYSLLSVVTDLSVESRTGAELFSACPQVQWHIQHITTVTPRN